jgi:hypothetical protein
MRMCEPRGRVGAAPSEQREEWITFAHYCALNMWFRKHDTILLLDPFSSYNVKTRKWANEMPGTFLILDK